MECTSAAEVMPFSRVGPQDDAVLSGLSIGLVLGKVEVEKVVRTAGANPHPLTLRLPVIQTYPGYPDCNEDLLLFD
jgi:hypothetical protein